MNRQMATSLVLGTLVAAGTIVALAGASAQPVPTPPGGPSTTLPVPGRSGVNEVNTLFLPPGKYTAIVISTTAKDRRWVVSLKTTRGNFPITVGAEDTVIVPFTNSWVVKADDQARLESKLVPWEDIGERNLLDGNENLSLAAWGITDLGPVSFAPPVKKK